MGLQGPDWEKEEAGELAGWEGTSESKTWPGSWTEQRQSLLRSWVGGAKLKGLRWKGQAVATLVGREGRGPWALPDSWIWEKAALGFDQTQGLIAGTTGPG